jgi:hypothetical protein
MERHAYANLLSLKMNEVYGQYFTNFSKIGKGIITPKEEEVVIPIEDSTPF